MSTVTKGSTTGRRAGLSKKMAQLRPARPADATLLFQWRAEPAVSQFQPLLNISLERLEADLALQEWAKFYRGEQEKFQWIILAADEAAGWITLVVTSWEHGLAEVGFSLATSFQRRSLMPQAPQLLLVEIFLRTSLERLEARCAVEN